MGNPLKSGQKLRENPVKPGRPTGQSLAKPPDLPDIPVKRRLNAGKEYGRGMSDTVDQQAADQQDGMPGGELSAAPAPRTIAQPGAVQGPVQIGRRGPLGEVLCLILDNPPRNALTADALAAMTAALAGFGAGDGAPSALLIAAKGGQFSTATALDQGQDQDRADLGAFCLAIEALPVPVVIALQGAVLGAGASLALAAHARIAGGDLRLAFPEAGLGLIPTAGATQRLPRLVGAEAALDLLLHARPIGAAEALEIGLIDRIAAGDLLEEALDFTLELARPQPVSARTDGISDSQSFLQAVAQGRAVARRSNQPAPARIVDCIEAALFLPFENGLLLETSAEEDLRNSPEARGLVASARAERRALTLPLALARAEGRAVARLGLGGSSPALLTLGRQALARGIAVHLAEPDPARRRAAQQWFSARFEAEEQAGRLSQAAGLAERARLVIDADDAVLGGSDLVIHAGAGPALQPRVRAYPGAVHLVSEGAPGFFGLTLAPSGRLAELALSGGGAPAAAMTAVQFLRHLQIQPALTLKMPIAGQELVAAGLQALKRLETSGVPRADLAAALEEFGVPLPDLPELPGRPAEIRRLPAAEIRNRWLGAMANAGFRLLEEGIARRPSDLDHIMVRGHGFPRWRSGPMHQAGLRGLMVLRSDLKRWAIEDPVWQAHPMIVRMIAAGNRISDLDLG